MGRIGVGSGKGFGGRARPSRAPAVKMGQSVVQGSLDKAVIQRVVRRHQNAVRYCYEKALVKNPALRGKVVMKWTIAKDGKVAAASVSESTLGDREVEGCLTRVVRRWRFPANEAGVVAVSYPFHFAPGPAAEAKEAAQ